ncbi:hypothetical protein CHS0354_012926 [Potamilus streckersoni]|uniref:Guanylate cyclase soluble subunit beta-1 n=1 Tax=Potamilus streckersoni TaxID=2493646 RepID=A0AAE0VHB5_9BIVA|nr:hypothetical protein CHS0354_012926 [Potamilus streckersoni]
MLQMDGNFLARLIYDDELTYDLVGAASEVLGKPASKILEMFGVYFFEFCQVSGYGTILNVLGGTTRDFLQNLDALHDHLATIYPGMRAPSFRCTEREDDGALILHYYSERPGLENIVIGIVKAVARIVHRSEVQVEVLPFKNNEVHDHVQLVITEKSMKPTDNMSSEIETCEHILSPEQKISPGTFCRAFPFHILFDRNMTIRQAGTSIMRVIPETADENTRVDEIFEMIRPHMDFEFSNILSHINTVFVLRTHMMVLKSDSKFHEDFHETTSMRLKGQMIYVEETDCILFMCSPNLTSLDELQRRGLYLSDIPLHDATRELVLLSEQFDAEYKLTQRLEVLTDKLAQKLRELEDEKKKTDRLMYSVLPTSVANELRHDRAVPARRYEDVTVLFSGIVGFSKFCANNSDSNGAMKIVELLNTIYTKFDDNLVKHPKVFKVRFMTFIKTNLIYS